MTDDELWPQPGKRLAKLAPWLTCAAWHLLLFFMPGTSQSQTPLAAFIMMAAAGRKRCRNCAIFCCPRHFLGEFKQKNQRQLNEYVWNQL